MWTRAQLKENAKRKLRNYYWIAVLACLVCSLLGAGTGTGVSTTSSYQSSDTETISYSDLIQNPESIQDYFKEYELPGYEYSYDMSGTFILIIVLFAIMVLLISLAFFVFVSNPIEVGLRRFFLLAGEGKASMGELFYAFRSGNYMNIVKTMFLQRLYIFLWSLLFIIPGIVKTYQYYMIPYILAEHPEMSSAEVFKVATDMSDREKWDMFVLALSFIGWGLLGALVSSVFSAFSAYLGSLVATAAALLLMPYVYATFTELFLCFKAKLYYSNQQGV